MQPELTIQLSRKCQIYSLKLQDKPSSQTYERVKPFHFVARHHKGETFPQVPPIHNVLSPNNLFEQTSGSKLIPSVLPNCRLESLQGSLCPLVNATLRTLQVIMLSFLCSLFQHTLAMEGKCCYEICCDLKVDDKV